MLKRILTVASSQSGLRVSKLILDVNNSQVKASPEAARGDLHLHPSWALKAKRSKQTFGFCSVLQLPAFLTPPSRTPASCISPVSFPHWFTPSALKGRPSTQSALSISLEEE